MTEVPTEKDKEDALQELVAQFELPPSKLKEIAHHLRKEMDLGLKTDDANVPMLPSWIMRHPTGQETGEYIGLELSGNIYL